MAEGFHNGYRISEFKEGDTTRTAESAAAMNEIVRAVNVLLNPRIQRGDSDSDVISEAGHVITLKKPATDGAIGTPGLGGANPIGLDLYAKCVIITPVNGVNGSDEAWVFGYFASVLRIGSFGPNVQDESCKRTGLVRFHRQLYPMPESWFLYNSTWVSPQPFTV